MGTPKQSSGTLVNYLKKDTDKNFVRVYDIPTPEALRAELDYEVVSSNNGKSLLKVNLKTGRSHQIRSQLAHMGCPIVGDVKYGAPEELEIQSSGIKHSMISLCATSITFKLATQEEFHTIQIPIPTQWG